MAVLLMPAAGHQVSLEANTARRLAGLGVTHVSVLQDDETVAVVLEGWAFDALASAGAAAELVSPGSGAARALWPVAHMSVAANAVALAREEVVGR